MSRSFQKQTKQDSKAISSSVEMGSIEAGMSIYASKEHWVSTATENKFEGMSERAEVVQPVIIPGYKIWDS